MSGENESGPEAEWDEAQEVSRLVLDLQAQLDDTKIANTAVWVMAERASRKGYDLDPHDVLDALAPTQPVPGDPS